MALQVMNLPIVPWCCLKGLSNTLERSLSVSGAKRELNVPTALDQIREIGKVPFLKRFSKAEL
jgi:hypothetical protein